MSKGNLEDVKRGEKSLKMSTGNLEAVNRRRTDNAMTKRQMTKVQTRIYIALHRKLKIEQQKPHY